MKETNKPKTSIKDLSTQSNPLVKLVELNETELLLVTGGGPPEGGTTSTTRDTDS